MKIKRILLIVVGALIAITATTTFLAGHFRHELYQAGIDAEAESLGLKVKTVEAANMTWSYMENDLRGQKPTLLMIHGFGSSKETWLAMSKFIADDFHLVMVDLPGHGDSTFDTSQNYDLEGLTRQFSAFVEAVGLTGFNLIGNSLGGGITGLYAGTHPQQLSSAIMLDPAGIVEYRSDYQKRLDEGENLLLVNTASDVDFLFEYAVGEKITIPWPFNQVIADKAVAKREIMDKVFADLTADSSYNMKAEVAEITAPTLLVWGKEDRLIAPENAALYQQANPSIKVELLDNIGHIPMVEIPEQCAEMVVRFIKAATS